jgi:hypothetical protein
LIKSCLGAMKEDKKILGLGVIPERSEVEEKSSDDEIHFKIEGH